MNWNRRPILLTVAILLILGAGLFHIQARRTLHSQLLADARVALTRNDFKEAELLARRLIADRAFPVDAGLIAGEAAVNLGANERALAYLAPLLDGRDENARIAVGSAASIRWEQGNASEAERLLRKLLDIDPDQPFALERLSHLLTLAGRHWESGPFRLTLFRNDQFEFDDLLLWGNSRALIQTDELTSMRQAAPDDPLLMLGAASIAVRKNDLATAEPLLARVISARPDLIEAHALQGSMLAERPATSAAELIAWNRGLPAQAEQYPEVWVVRGLWTMRQGSAEGAARCFWEALRRSPNHQLANYQMALMLKQLGDDNAVWFSTRADQLQELERMLGVLNTDRKDLAAMQKVVELNDKLGRIWEKWGWSRVALLVNPNQDWARQSRDSAKKLLTKDSPQVLASEDPGQRFDYSRIPVPQWLATSGS